MKKESKKIKGFTLIEMLVVVLIIGILAAIALPQYQMSVGKAKFATLKNITKSLAESVNRYYMIHNAYPKSYTELDLDFSVKSGSGSTFTPTTRNIDSCEYWADNNQMAACYSYILGNFIGYYVSYDGTNPLLCYVYGLDKNNIAHKICQQDTNKTEEQGHCPDSRKYCVYYY